MSSHQADGYLYHDPSHSPMKLREPMKAVKALVGGNVLKIERCCGESGTLSETRPGISTQVRFHKEEELRQGEQALRSLLAAAPGLSGAAQAKVKILTSCPSCLQGLKRFEGDLQSGLLEADYIMVEMARLIWAPPGWKTARGGRTRVGSSVCWSSQRGAMLSGWSAQVPNGCCARAPPPPDDGPGTCRRPVGGRAQHITRA